MDLGSSLRPNMRGITGFCDQETERDNRTNTQKEISQTHDSVRMTPQSKKNDKCHDEQQCSIMFYLHDHCIYYTIATSCQRKWTQKLEGYWTVDSSTLALPVGQT